MSPHLSTDRKRWLISNNGLKKSPKISYFYGPQSSGKTTLIYKFVDEYLIDENKFSVKMFNLREVLIVNYVDFLQRFFQVEDQKEKDTSETHGCDNKNALNRNWELA